MEHILSEELFIAHKKKNKIEEIIRTYYLEMIETKDSSTFWQ